MTARIMPAGNRSRSGRPSRRRSKRRSKRSPAARPDAGQRPDRRRRARPGPGRQLPHREPRWRPKCCSGPSTPSCPHDMAVLGGRGSARRFPSPSATPLRKRYRYVIHDGPVRDVFRRRYSWHYATAGWTPKPCTRAAAAASARTTSAASRPPARRGRTASARSSTSRVERGRGARARTS